MTLTQMLGQKLVFGFHGTSLSPEFKALIRKYKIGNVILFLRNVESANQLRRLCDEIRTLILEETGYPPFIIIDQEGGMVSRLPKDAVNVPGAMALAATGNPENARLASEITVRQLKGLGANFNMAPVLDVNSNANNPCAALGMTRRLWPPLAAPLWRPTRAAAFCAAPSIFLATETRQWTATWGFPAWTRPSRSWKRWS